MADQATRITLIRERLEKALTPQRLDIVDESHLHIGHASAAGGGHFRLEIVSDKFQGLSVLAQHRLVYQALNDLMKKEIHALSIHTNLPQ